MIAGVRQTLRDPRFDTRAWIAVAAIALALAVLLPFATDPYIESLAINAGILAIVTISWNLMGGFGGLFSFGQAGFFGAGAYATGIFAEHQPAAPVPLLLAFGIAGGAVCGILVLPCLRASGIYFAIITLAFAEALKLLAGHIFPGGVNGVFIEPVFGVDTHDAYLFTLAALVAAIAVTVAVRRSALGLALSALRGDEAAAESVGVNTLATKATVCVISGGLAGLAGGMFALNQTFVSPQSGFDVSYSVLPVLAATLGGIGTIAGPVIGTLLYSAINELVRQGAATSGPSSIFVYGSVLIVLAIFLPRGVLGLLAMLRSRLAGEEHGDGADPGASSSAPEPPLEVVDQ